MKPEDNTYYCIECGAKIRHTKVIRAFIKTARAEEFEDPDIERHLCGICAVRELRKNKSSVYYFPQIPKNKARRFEKRFGKFIDVPQGNLLGMKISAGDVDKLARWHYYFDDERWPEDFPRPMPEGFETMSYLQKRVYTAPLKALIKAIIGAKECCRFAQMRGRNLSAFEFEQWWEKWKKFHETA